MKTDRSYGFRVCPFGVPGFLLATLVFGCQARPNEPLNASGAPDPQALLSGNAIDQLRLLSGEKPARVPEQKKMRSAAVPTDKPEYQMTESECTGGRCRYMAIDLEGYHDGCFAAMVSNTWTSSAHITVRRRVDGQMIEQPVDQFTRIPAGQGTAITYGPYSAVTGIAPGEVALLFLSGPATSGAPCPSGIAPAVPGSAVMKGTGIGMAFEIETDVPVVAHQINPYGGGSYGSTGASLLLPSSACSRDYIAMNAYAAMSSPTNQAPSLNVVAFEDSTVVTFNPVAAVVGGNGIPASPANTLFTVTLQRGEHMQIAQVIELTGSIVSASKTVGVFASHQCAQVPVGASYCDHTEQMIPPVQGFGREYAAVQHKARGTTDPSRWRIMSAADGTTLSFDPAVHAPTTLGLGQWIEFESATPFVVNSQDEQHAFFVAAYMASSSQVRGAFSGDSGDPDMVNITPPQHYLSKYVFFADPSYSTTNLVLVRQRRADSSYPDVVLDCAGVLVGWQNLDAGGRYQFTRMDLVNGNFVPQGSCDNGAHTINSTDPFGLWVWGWGNNSTTPDTRNVSYGYPAGYRTMSIPTGVAASDGSFADKVRVTWTASGGTSYQVYRNTSNSTSGATLLGSPSVSPYDDTSATPGIVYYYFVKACNVAGCTELSTSDSGYRAISAPTGVNASDGSYADRVRIAWTASTGATSYQVYRNSSSSSGGATQIATPTVSPYDDTTATPGAIYYYLVKACNGTVCSDFGTPDSGYRSGVPQNDDFAGATSLVTVPFLSTIDVTNATTAVDDPPLTSCSRPAGTKSVWYSYTPGSSRLVYLDSFGSSYDTMIGVFTGARGSLTAVACNDDDSRSPGGLHSGVSLNATAGTTYYIVVYSKAAVTTATLQFHATTFYDVPGSQSFWRYIEGFYAQGITTGCSTTPFSYCPDNPVTRAAMAVFLLRAMHGPSYTPPAATGIFTDLPVTGKEWMQPWVEEFYRQGITTGCASSPLRYCPETSVTRAAMAVFVLRSIKGTSWTPPPSTGIFADVPVAGKEWMQPWVEEFYREGITTGCGTDPLRYCPENPVTRGAMAVFISRAYSLPQLP